MLPKLVRQDDLKGRSSAATRLQRWHAPLQVNGRPMVAVETTERLAAACATQCGRFLLTGGTKGAVALRWLHSLQVGVHRSVKRVPACRPCTYQPGSLCVSGAVVLMDVAAAGSGGAAVRGGARPYLVHLPYPGAVLLGRHRERRPCRLCPR